MSDSDHLRQVPQPRKADIVRLAPDRLARLFSDGVPNALSPTQARIAIAMHRLGRDAREISERAIAPIATVVAFLDSIKPRSADAAAAASIPSTEPAPADEPLEADAPATNAAPVVEPAPAKVIPREVELSDLQQRVIRRLREVRISTATISRMTRIAVDQVMRVAGEIP
jgi:hypothetical protein